MRATELLKDKIFKLCMSFDGVWISQEELDEAAKELEKLVKENSEDRLAELEKVILDYYLAKGYQVGVGGWAFNVEIDSDYKSKNLIVYFLKGDGYGYCNIFEVRAKTTKEMFDKAFKYFSLEKENIC